MLYATLLEWIAGEKIAELSTPQLQFNIPIGTLAGLFLVLACGLLAAWHSWPRLAKLDAAPRIALCVFRMAVIIIALALAFDPVIVGSLIQPGDHYVLLLFDDSSSMNVVEPDGKTRAAKLLNRFNTPDQKIQKALEAKFQLIQYRFGAQTERIPAMDRLEFQQNQSDPARAVREALFDMEGLNVSAIALFSDGRKNTDAPDESIESTIPSGVPVFAVHIGDDQQWTDLRIDHLSFRQTPFDKSPVVFFGEIAAEGLAGNQAVLEILEGDRVVASKNFSIENENQTNQIRLDFIPAKKEWIEYQARVRLIETALGNLASAIERDPAMAKDRIPQNNAQSFLVDNRKRARRILYFSGRPNWENKFYRSALEDDDELRLASLIRISGAEKTFVYRGQKTTMTNPLFEGYDTDTEKWGRYDEPVFLRLGASEYELVKGFPKDAEELFEFDALILGDIEREFFTTAQLELIRDFADKRGGAFLFMGGDRSFTDGGYNGTVIESMLPVVFFSDYQSQAAYLNDAEWMAMPTLEGTLSGAWSLDSDSQVNDQLWQDMPPLFGFNRFALTRAGAEILSYNALSDSGRSGSPVFAIQRYGNGRCAVFATADTWQWQMKSGLEDQRHERLWRQITRYLLQDVPQAATLRNKEDVYRIGKSYPLEFHLRDKTYDDRAGLRATVTLMRPNHPPQEISVDESIEENGIYQSLFDAQDPGLHAIQLDAFDDEGELIASLDEAVLAQPNMDEYQNARPDPAYLRAIAEHTGGQFLTLDDLPSLPARLPWKASEETEIMQIHLWHFPGFYFLLLMLLSAEWFLRRKKGQA